jgi:3-polyprenyl-4-hydroxybenzoate decarboxylase
MIFRVRSRAMSAGHSGASTSNLHPRPTAWKRAAALLAFGTAVMLLSGASPAEARQACPCSIWTLSTTPGANGNEASALELGVKFRADSNGYITGLRFYKYAQNTGTHIGNLWSSTGTLLGTVTFANESASGWQQATFPSPIAIAAATTYVASYHTDTGFYAATNNGFSTGVDTAPLHALSDAAAGGNGVYRYGSSGFPTQTYQAGNYWVDVVFAFNLAPDTTPPTVTAVTPTANATGVSVGTTVTATFSEAMDAATVTSSTMTLRNGATTVSATVASANGVATLTPGAALASSTTYTVTVKGGTSGVKDVAGNPLAADLTWSFTTAAPVVCPCSIWTLTTTPGANSNDAGALELGLKFRADSNGYITGLRFYKYAQNTGTHIGNLWSAAGALLGTVTFANESASGWQQAAFPSPIAITAATTYVASYHTNTGYYAATNNGLSTSVDTAPLHALSDAAAGGNGLYRYGSASAFPNQTYQAGNYWVDVVFSPNLAPDTTPPTVTTVTPTANATGVAVGTTVTAAFSEAMDAATITATTVSLRNGATQVSATVAYASGVATLTPSAALASSTTYTVTVKGGTSGVKDVAGNALAADLTWSFTTAAPVVCPCSIWTLTTTPGANSNDVGALELGLKFRADSNGYITGLRFYKYAQNTGTHIGNLWSSTGTLLGTVTFANESASGWQQAAFPSPIAITAATTYVASYHTNTGYYAATNNGLSTSVDTAPLHALSDAAAGGNGLYRYSSASAFPAQTYQAGNYWVDVVFSPNLAPDTTPPTITSTAPATNATGVSVGTTVTATFSETMDAATVTSSTMTLRNGATPVSATVASANGVATLTPVAPLAGSTTYSVTVKGGASGVKDLAGNPLAADLTWSFTTAAGVVCPCSIWTLTTTPGANSNEASALELGLKFRADTNGFITGLRFYKYAQNTGTHIGNLWSAAGALLGTVTFANESASGWQQATFTAPIAIVAATTYVASYHTNTGFYAATNNGLGTGVDTAPLHALSDAAAGGNGLYRYGSASAFPAQSYQAGNYWVDVVFTPNNAPETTPPTITSTAPGTNGTGAPTGSAVRAIFSEAMDATTITATTVSLRNGSTQVASTVTYASGVATLTPSAALANSTTYTATVKGGSSGVKDLAGNALAADYVWSFTTAPPAVAPTSGAGGPILIVASSTNPFSRYYAEILRAEGLNEFAVTDASALTASLLAGYDVVLLGEQALTAAQVVTLTNWVASGGNLIAMRPDSKLAGLLGLASDVGTLTNAYLLVDTSKAPGAGIVGQTMQFHGPADRYLTVEASAVATLYSDATHASANPAVSLRASANGSGSTAAFSYDLARSIVYTRQGNPAWSGQERDGFAPIRSDDLFFGAKAGDTQPDWIDLSKVAIPQADEQQRLLANLIVFMNRSRKPLPRLWYLPRGLKAAVVMTGDDHANNGTAGRFDIYNSNSPVGCNVDNWECVRATSYIFLNTPITSAQVGAYTAQGFEIGNHMWMSGLAAGGDAPTSVCNDYSPVSVAADYSKQLTLFSSLFPTALPVRTNRTHCIVWSDFDSQASAAAANGIRFDTNYYYWPPSWTIDVPGVFTGSGMPMRFAKADGTMLDVYQATTQMTDESGQTYPKNVDVLLDNALGATGYYGAFVANMHTDTAVHAGSQAIVASALARSVPIVSAVQMLTWIDGRNSTAFGPIAWSNNVLSFSVVPGTGANGLQMMLPVDTGTLHLGTVTLNGTPVASTVRTIKGVAYAFVTVGVGQYQATYVP